MDNGNLNKYNLYLEKSKKYIKFSTQIDDILKYTSNNFLNCK